MEAKGILDELNNHHDGWFGYAIYRCAYDDDAAWSRFIDLLTAHVHAGLDNDECGDTIRSRFKWDIFENKDELDGATKSQVRERQKQWRMSVGGSLVHPRYGHCIYADKEVIDSVLQGDEPGSSKYNDIMNPKAFVKLLDEFFEEEFEGGNAMNDSKTHQKSGSDKADRPPIDGCTLADVGWMKVAAKYLVPSAYRMLLNNGWHLFYVRPSGIMSG